MKERRTWELPATVPGDPNFCPIDVGDGERCDKPAGTTTRGWCAAHYQRWRKTGEAGGPIRTKPIHVCVASGCEVEVFKPGLCAEHEATVKGGEQPGLRPCWHCLQWKPVEQFERKRGNGLTRFCTPCIVASRRATNGEHPVRPRKSRETGAVIDGMKRCPRCRRDLPLVEFLRKTGDGKPFARCKECRREANRNSPQARRKAEDARRRLGLPLDTPLGMLPGPTALPAGTRRPASGGYVIVKVPGHPFAEKDGWIKEHRYAMEQLLGRYLQRHENVHHINGDRADNRTDGPLVNFRSGNLELWSTHQPKGQRIEDKLAWARDMLALYGTTAERKFHAAAPLIDIHKPAA